MTILGDAWRILQLTGQPFNPRQSSFMSGKSESRVARPTNRSEIERQELAGAIRRAPAAEFPQSDWDELIAVNLTAVFRLSQLAGQSMLKRGTKGKILNIGSLLSFQGGILVPAYAAAKGGVAQLTKALANEWASQGINVNAIAPGYMATDNTTALRNDPQRSRQILERIPAARWGEPSDIAGAAVFLCSPASDYINGHVMSVDGGWMGR